MEELQRAALHDVAIGLPQKRRTMGGSDGRHAALPRSGFVQSRLPVLYVMHNNRAYHQERMVLQRMANRRQRGFDRNHIGTTLEDPFIDYATVAKGLGMASFGPVTDPNDLGPVLKKAVAVVKSGEPALVDVVSQGR
jgi:thiamine pyrophosphate-dependent acetolactate synthase large subunit-like protein